MDQIDNPVFNSPSGPVPGYCVFTVSQLQKRWGNHVRFFFFCFFYFSTKSYIVGTHWKRLKRIYSGASNEYPQLHWGASNEYPQHMVLWRNKNNQCFLVKTISLSGVALRKHAYSNILKILQPKPENFQIKKL